MKIYKLAASLSDIPYAQQKGWNPPSDAVLMQHIYMIDESSPLKKDYIIRVVAFEVPGTTDVIRVTMSYYGGSVDKYGYKTLSDQRRSYVISAAKIPRNRVDIGAYTDAWNKRNQQNEDGYKLISDHRWKYSDNVMARSVDILSDVSSMNIGGANRSPPSAPKSPSAPVPGQPNPNNINPSTYNTNKETVDKISPTPEEIENQARIEAEKKRQEEIQSNIRNCKNILTTIKQGGDTAKPAFNQLMMDIIYLKNHQDTDDGYSLMMSPPVKRYIEEIVNYAANDGTLFYTVLSYPLDLLTEIGLSDAARKRIESFNDLSNIDYNEEDFKDI